MNNYQKQVARTDRTEAGYVDLQDTLDNPKLKLMHGVLGVAGEAGELVDAVKKHLMYGKELDVQNVKEEAGDLLWYMSLILTTVDSSFEEVMGMNINKLKKRYPEGFTEEAAQARADEVE